MKNPQTKERPPLAKTSKDKMTTEENEKNGKSGAPDIILGHKRSPSVQRRQSQPASRRSQSRGKVSEGQRLSRGGSEARESSVEMDEEMVVRKFSSTSEQQKSVDRLSRVTTREKRTCEGEIKKGNHCHQGRSRSSSPEKRSHSMRRKPARSVGGRGRLESGGKKEENPRRSSSSQQQKSGSKTDTRRSQSINRGGVMVGAESGAVGIGIKGSRSNSSGPTPKTKVLKTTDGGSMSTSRKETKAKEKALKEVKVFVNGSSMDAKQDSEVASGNVVTESGILQENGVVEESISASEAIIRLPFLPGDCHLMSPGLNLRLLLLLHLVLKAASK